MTIRDQIGDKKLQYDITKEAAKISTLSLGEIDQYEYLRGEEILPSDQGRSVEQAKYIYFSLGKALEKETKAIKDQGEKQISAIENRVKKKILEADQKSITDLISKKFFSEEAIYDFF